MGIIIGALALFFVAPFKFFDPDFRRDYNLVMFEATIPGAKDTALVIFTHRSLRSSTLRRFCVRMSDGWHN